MIDVSKLVALLRESVVELTIEHYRTGEPFKVIGTLQPDVCEMDVVINPSSEQIIICNEDGWQSFYVKSIKDYQAVAYFDKSPYNDQTQQGDIV